MDHLSILLTPITVEQFAGTYFQKQALYIPGREGKFIDYFATRDFVMNLSSATQIRAVFPQLRQARIRIADMCDMLRAGASICVTGMEKAHPKLGELCTSVKKRIRYAGIVSCRAYLSPAGAGFDLHYDARVSTTLQISGTKTWWYLDDEKTRYPLQNSPHTPYLREVGFDPPSTSEMKKVTLTPGDLLCLPAGTWHKAKANEGSLALNLAFDHRRATVGNWLTDFMQADTERHLDMRKPTYSLREDPWNDEEIRANTRMGIGLLRETLNKLDDDEALTLFLKHFTKSIV